MMTFGHTRMELALLEVDMTIGIIFPSGWK